MEQPLRGILMLCAATMCFSLSDATAKYLTGSLPPIEIAWVRYVVFTLLASLGMKRGGLASVGTRRPVLQILRGLGVAGSALLFIFALSRLPIAQATTINAVSPLLTVALSAPILREVVGLRGWVGVLAGFIGVLIVVRPGTSAFPPAAFLVLGSSLCWSAAMLVTRRMAATERSTATVFWTAASGLVLLSLLLPFGFVVPSRFTLALTFFVGIISSGGQWLTILAYRHAAASVLAPLSYVQLIWSTGLGVLLFHATPDGWTLLGAMIIAGSGIYTVQRERLRLRAERRGAVQRPLSTEGKTPDAIRRS
jgi:drug/metabolite transporter (DMT)-like permease